MFAESSTETPPEIMPESEAAPLLDLPPEISNRLTRWCIIPSLGALARTCRLWNERINNDNFWKERIFRELTKQPRLKPGQTYKEYYIEIYHSKRNISYRKYLTEPLVPFSEERYDVNSLDACLFSACAQGCEIWAEEVILRGANVNRNFAEQNPLDIAVRNGYPHIIKLLYKYEANVNIFIHTLFSFDDVHRTPLHALTELPHTFECTKELFTRPVRIVPPLHNAVIRHAFQSLTKLLKNPQVDVNGLDSAKMSALAWALLLDENESSAVLLMEANASVLDIAPAKLAPRKMWCVGNISALTLIIYNKSIPLLECFLKKYRHASDNFHISIPEYDGGMAVSGFMSALEWCVKCNFSEGLRILLEAGVTSGLNAAVCVAVESEFDLVDCLAMLIKARPNLNYKRVIKTEDRKEREIDIKTPLTLATHYGNANCVALLLRHGANPNLFEEKQRTDRNTSHVKHTDEPVYEWKEQPRKRQSPLQNAVDYLTSKTYLRYEELPDPKERSHENESRLWRKQQNDALRAEFERKDYSPHDPKNPISFRALACIKVLLEHNANTQDGDALSCLIRSIKNATDLFSQNTNTLILAAIEILFKHGATLNPVKSSGLHHGLKTGCLALIKVLIEKGNAKLEEKDDQGRSVMEVALEKNNPEIIEYLEHIKTPSKSFTF